MNSADAFVYAMSGSYTENQMQHYANYVNQNNSTQGVSGWLAQQATKSLDNFNTFLTSRAWEMGARLAAQREGDFVGQFDIGYLGSINGLQGARGFMRDYIMAHAGLHQDYLDEKIEGYGGDFHSRCTGIAEENMFWRRAMNGVLNFTEKENVPQLRHAHYHESLGGGLSFRERNNIQKTWAAIDHHRAKQLFDITSPGNVELGKYVRPVEGEVE